MESEVYEQFRDGVGLGSASAFWPGEARQLGDRALLVTGHGNVGYVYYDEGVVMIDTGLPQVFGDHAVKELRRFTEAPIRMVVYTHGHLDHAFNLGPVLADAQARYGACRSDKDQEPAQRPQARATQDADGVALEGHCRPGHWQPCTATGQSRLGGHSEASPPQGDTKPFPCRDQRWVLLLACPSPLGETRP